VSKRSWIVTDALSNGRRVRAATNIVTLSVEEVIIHNRLLVVIVLIATFISS
jgi:hypothetical protein